MLVHIRPVIIWFDHSLDSPLGNGLWPVLCPTTVLTVSPPSAQSPFAQCGCDLPLRRRSFRLLGGHYSSFFAPTDSFVSRSGLSSTSVLPRSRSLCKLSTSPCCPPDLPDVISVNPSWMLDPIPRRSHSVPIPVSSGCVIGLPQRRPWVGFPLMIRLKRLLAELVFRGGRYFFMFRPPSLCAPQVVPTAALTAAGQPELLRPGRTCFVTSARTGYANRPNSGN